MILDATTPTDHAYAAGLFDGEGSVMIMPGLNTEKWKTHPRLYVSLSQVETHCLSWLQGKYGGKVRLKNQPEPQRRAAFEWYLCGKNAINFLSFIRPYLILKAPQADLAFEFRKTVQPKGGIRTPVAPEMVSRREDLRLKMKALNKRGVA